MKVTEQDIIRTARLLRDEENEQLHVTPWGHRPRRFATWLIAVPAAAILGFVFGFWTKSNSQIDASLTALVDTIYIKVHDPQPLQDTIAQLTPKPQHPAPTTQKAPPAAQSFRPLPGASSAAAQHRPQPVLGRPVAEDNIRYDLLVRN